MRTSMCMLLALMLSALFLCGRAAADEEIMGVSQVKTGMKGVGRTVFKGTKVEEFPVTVVGVLRKFVAESDVILVRVDGGYPVEHGTGVIAGMSGSPIYIDGKLVGAIAYGWTFAKEPIAGVTPIEHMLRELPSGGAAPVAVRAGNAKHSGRAARLGAPIVAKGRKYTKVRLVDMPTAADAAEKETIVLSPVGALMQLHGFSPRAVERLRKAFGPMGLTVAAAPGGEGAEPLPGGVPQLVPGSAVGVQLLSGDLSIAGTGTLTYRRGNEFLAFGHPMMELGATSLPFTASFIQDIMPGYQRSFKLATQLAVVGELSQDRLFAVGGTLHRTAPTLPLALTVRDSERKLEKTYSCRSAMIPMLTPVIVSIAMEDAIASVSSLNGEKHAKVTYTFELDGREPLVIEEMQSGRSIAAAVADQLGELMSELGDNDFTRVGVQSVKVAVDVGPGRREAVVERIFLNKTEFKPGDTMELNVVLQPWGAAKEVRRFRIPLPAHGEGSLKMGVFGGSLAKAARKKMMLPEPQPYSLSQYLRNIRRRERGYQLRVLVALPTKGGSVEGEVFPALPSSVAEVFQNAPQSDIVVERDLLALSCDTPWFVKGGEVFGLKVEKKKKDASRGEKEPDSFSVSVNETPLADGVSDIPVKELARAAAVKSVPGKSGAPQPEKREKPMGTSRVDIRTESQVARGTFAGTALTSKGEITLAPAASRTLVFDEPFFWSAAWDPRGRVLYLGQGSSGKILAVKEDGTSKVLATLRDEVAPTAMRVLSSGELLVGTSPEGRLYRIDGEGRASLVRDFKESYLWSIVEDGGGNVYVAAGNPGVLYRLMPSGNAMEVFAPGQSHIRCMALDRKGRLFLGTSEHGIVYREESPGKFTPLLETPGESVDALAASADGAVYAASGDTIYSFTDGRRATLATLPEKVVMCLAVGRDGKLLAGTHPSGRVYSVGQDGEYTRILDKAAGEVTGIVDAGSFLWVAASNPSSLWKVDGRLADEGTYESEVVDAGAESLWGSLRWSGSAEGGGTLTVQTRSGQTEAPDGTWSFWSLPSMHAKGDSIKSAPGRYLQYRVTLKRGGGEAPVFRGISFFYRNVSQEPRITWLAPSGGELLGGKVKLEWRVQSPDAENVLYDLSYSKDRGATWQNLVQGWQQGGGGGDSEPASERGVPAGSRAQGGRKVTWEWDAGKLADGEYLVKVTGYWFSDTGGNRTVETSPLLTLCNTPPKIEISSWAVEKERLVVKGFVTSPGAVIFGITYRVDGAQPKSILPGDGMYDSFREDFSFELPLPKGAKSLELKALDEAGNTGVLTRAVGQ